MTNKVPEHLIEEIVGISRHKDKHFGKYVSKENTIYILHSEWCLEHVDDLTLCWYSQALDWGAGKDWDNFKDETVELAIGYENFLITLLPKKIEPVPNPRDIKNGK